MRVLPRGRALTVVALLKRLDAALEQFLLEGKAVDEVLPEIKRRRSR